MGLCLGSFLNAVIYRLPRNRSLRDPPYSACPNCRHRIAWYDNIPVISFVLLGGRCRNCGIPISTQYVVIEVSMALVVLMLLDAFFIGHARIGLSDSPFGLTDRLAHDWPILAAHVILFACLLPMSAIDLEHYWVDVRFTNLAVFAGFVCHTLWTPKHSREWIRPWDTTGTMCLFALVALAVVWLILVCQPRWGPEESEDGSMAGPERPPVLPLVHPLRRLPSSLAAPSRFGGWVGCGMLLTTVVFLAFDEAEATGLRHTGRALLPLGFFFVLIIWESTLDRPADHQIMQAINEEREGARVL